MDIVLEQIMLYVDQIAGLVGDTAPVVWGLLMRQVYVQIAGNAIYALVGLALIVGASKSIKPIKKAIENQGSYDDNGLWFLATGTMYILGLVFFLDGLYCVVARLINPAWYAIKLLLETAGIGG